MSAPLRDSFFLFLPLFSAPGALLLLLLHTPAPGAPPLCSVSAPGGLPAVPLGVSAPGASPARLLPAPGPPSSVSLLLFAPGAPPPHPLLLTAGRSSPLFAVSAPGAPPAGRFFAPGPPSFGLLSTSFHLWRRRRRRGVVSPLAGGLLCFFLQVGPLLGGREKRFWS